MQAIFLRKKKRKGSVLLGTKQKGENNNAKKTSRDAENFHPNPAEMEMVAHL